MAPSTHKTALQDSEQKVGRKGLEVDTLANATSTRMTRSPIKACGHKQSYKVSEANVQRRS
jgi:hypothetical protein